MVDFESCGARTLPIRWADTLMKVPYSFCMQAKYGLYKQDWRNWKEKAMWVRDRNKEAELFEHLRLDPNSKYTLINRFFGSASQFAAAINERGIEIQTIPGFSLFDWAGVIEKASAIHVVSSSIIYLLELLELRAPEVHIYPRLPHENHLNNVEYILTSHNYIKHV